MGYLSLCRATLDDKYIIFGWVLGNLSSLGYINLASLYYFSHTSSSQVIINSFYWTSIWEDLRRMNFGSDLKKVEGIEIKGCPQRSTHHISNIHCDIGCPILIPLTFILMCFNLPRALRIWLSQQLQCLILVWISFVYKDYSCQRVFKRCLPCYVIHDTLYSAAIFRSFSTNF